MDLPLNLHASLGNEHYLNRVWAQLEASQIKAPTGDVDAGLAKTEKNQTPRAHKYIDIRHYYFSSASNIRFDRLTLRMPQDHIGISPFHE